MSIAFRPIDINGGLTIMATSEDSIEFAHMSLTKDELALDVETGKARKSMIWVVHEWRVTEQTFRDH